MTIRSRDEGILDEERRSEYQKAGGSRNNIDNMTAFVGKNETSKIKFSSLPQLILLYFSQIYPRVILSFFNKDGNINATDGQTHREIFISNKSLL